MPIKGTMTDDYYIPEPSIRAIEAVLAEIIGRRRCDGCGKPLGNDPRRMLDRKQYHPGCALGSASRAA